uniref:Uncharacterized protein n=1 Tax=Panagrolaimus superbus TaxID=310955 RepID=A0A914ZBY2_9BILA
MAFGCFTTPKDKSKHAKDEEYSSPLHPSNLTGIDVQPSEVKEKQKKFSLFGKKNKKISLMKATLDQQAKAIEELTTTMNTEKTSYEAEIARLQARLKTKEEDIKKLHAQKTEMIRTRDAEKAMINENMTLIEKIFAPTPAQDTSDPSSPTPDVSKKAKKKNSMLRRKKRDQKNEIHVASEIDDGVA